MSVWLGPGRQTRHGLVCRLLFVAPWQLRPVELTTRPTVFTPAVEYLLPAGGRCAVVWVTHAPLELGSASSAGHGTARSGSPRSARLDTPHFRKMQNGEYCRSGFPWVGLSRHCTARWHGSMLSPLEPFRFPLALGSAPLSQARHGTVHSPSLARLDAPPSANCRREEMPVWLHLGRLSQHGTAC